MMFLASATLPSASFLDSSTFVPVSAIACPRVFATVSLTVETKVELMVSSSVVEPESVTLGDTALTFSFT